MELKIVGMSDQHINAPRIASNVIADNIRKVIFPRLQTGDVSLLVSSGDYFDGPMELGGTSCFTAMSLLQELVELSLTHGFFIRFLQGTFTHDRNQTRMFNLGADKLPLLNGHRRVKFYDMLDIEQLKPLGINILYKPDDLPYKDAFKRMQTMVTEAKLPIDLFINHGFFKHLLPYGIPHEPINTLEATAIESLVCGMTLNGHVHTPSIYKRVVNVGSFDRLAHGEEEPKGFFELKYDTETKQCERLFVENKYATIFKTINLAPFEQNISSCKTHVKKVIDDLLTTKISTSRDMFIRLISNSVEVRQALRTYVTQAFADVVVSDKSIDAIQPRLESLDASTEPLEALPTITVNNLAEMIVEHTIHIKTPLSLEYVNKVLDLKK